MRLSVLLPLVLVTGCSGESARTSDAAGTDQKTPVAATAAPSAQDLTKAKAAISVDAEGLRLVILESGSTRPIPFGTEQAFVVSAIEKLRGPAKVERNEECGAGPVDFAQFGDFTLLFQDGKFGGWSLANSDADGIGTMNGISVGSRRKALDDAFAGLQIVPDSTLGTEFVTGEDGGLSGLLDGNGPEAKVTNLWAGLSCIFR